MSEEQLKAFLDAVKADKSLQNKLKEAIDPDDVLAVAREAGFAVSAEELKKAQAEIADNELEGVAGGGLFPANWLAGNVNRTNNQVVVDGRLLPSTPC